MKKFILTLALVASFVGVLNAQADGKAIGLRLGYPTEVSYQQALSNLNRVELGLGLRSYSYRSNYNYTRFSFSGVYQWVWDLSALSDGFNWYAGVGGMVGFYSYKDGNNTYSGVPVSLLGQVGIEYNFNIPIRLSLDYRPAIQINADGNGFVADGIALGVRYKF